ncbi:hypothetical protein V5O48_018419, partial [Marasmius crinis-equi]
NPTSIEAIVAAHVTYTKADRSKFAKIRYWVRTDYKDGTSKGDAIVVEEVVQDVDDENGGPDSESDGEEETLQESKRSGSKKENKQQRFLERLDGSIISSNEAKVICQYARLLFHELKQKNLAPEKWVGGVSSESRSQFYARLTKAYPVVSYCENNWKAEYLAIQLYPQWHKGKKTGGSISETGQKRKRVKEEMVVDGVQGEIDLPTKKHKSGGGEDEALLAAASSATLVFQDAPNDSVRKASDNVSGTELASDSDMVNLPVPLLAQDVVRNENRQSKPNPPIMQNTLFARPRPVPTLLLTVPVTGVTDEKTSSINSTAQSVPPQPSFLDASPPPASATQMTGSGQKDVPNPTQDLSQATVSSPAAQSAEPAVVSGTAPIQASSGRRAGGFKPDRSSKAPKSLYGCYYADNFPNPTTAGFEKHWKEDVTSNPNEYQ